MKGKVMISAAQRERRRDERQVAGLCSAGNGLPLAIEQRGTDVGPGEYDGSPHRNGAPPVGVTLGRDVSAPIDVRTHDGRARGHGQGKFLGRAGRVAETGAHDVIAGGKRHDPGTRWWNGDIAGRYV